MIYHFLLTWCQMDQSEIPKNWHISVTFSRGMLVVPLREKQKAHTNLFISIGIGNNREQFQ